MPRARKPGGPRAGTPGTAYQNRTDLNQQRSAPLAAQAATGQTYGDRKSQLESQRLVPMAPQPTSTPGPSPTTGQPAASPGGPPAAPPIAPGQFGAFNRPTERPDEHILTGAPPVSVPAVADRVGSLLGQMASDPAASSDVKYLLSSFGQGRA